jgi:hypothetical protein
VLIEVADVRDAPVGVGPAFRRAYLNEAQEVFLDGHVRAFEHFGGVPTADPLRQLEDGGGQGAQGPGPHRVRPVRADAFALRVRVVLLSTRHRGRHEKGGVEGEVGRFRRRHLVPVPRVASMAELNELLDAHRAA